MRKPIVGGNWKMNLDRAGGKQLASSVAGGLGRDAGRAEVVVFPPFTMLAEVAEAVAHAKVSVAVGGQDLWPAPSGAFTGEVSAGMLADAGATWVLVGHSERRHVIGEDEALIARKLVAALDAELATVLCVGETEQEREAGRTDEVNVRQLRSALEGIPGAALAAVVLAYEPVWAIGTGKTATPADAQAVHARLRAELAELYGASTADRVRIQYGGSVKPDNAAELAHQPDIDGFLVGGASLRAADFLPIVSAAAARAAV